MTPEKKQLEELFQRVANDTPSLERDELRSLLEQKASVHLPMGPLQTSVINEDRKRGFTKGIFIMTLIGVFITAMLLLFSNQEAKKSTQQEISSTLGESVKPQNENIAVGQQNNETTYRSLPSKSKDSAFHFLKFEPINLASVTPIPIGANDPGKIGLLKNEQGEVIMYHADTKVVFPSFEPTNSPNIDKDARASLFKNLVIHPSYATDSRGNLLMIYKYTKDSNSTIMNLSLLDDAERIKDALASNYYRRPATRAQDGDLDSSNTPWLVKNVKYNVTVGIMTFDTIMTNVFHEHNPMIKPLIERLAMKDSLYKMQFGGEAGLREKFQFPTEQSKLSVTERRVSDSLKTIERTVQKNRKEILQTQLDYLGNLINSKLPDTLKLKIEQLSYKIGYEEYILDHQEEAKTLESIGSLVPISVRENTGMKKDGKYDNGLIFWYEPSEELFNAIPQARERAAVDNSLFHMSDEVKNVVLYPNPASLYLFVSYTISHRTTIDISILDLLGRTVAENISSQSVPSGEHKESISLGSIPAGIYLILIRTDTGQQNIQRLVIEK